MSHHETKRLANGLLLPNNQRDGMTFVNESGQLVFVHFIWFGYGYI